jgi:hypothetical protein
VAESDRYAIALEAIRALDRAASKGILHRNNAARRKARLARQLVKLGGVPAAGAAAASGSKSKKGAAPAKGAAAVAAGKSKAPDKKAAAKKPSSK